MTNTTKKTNGAAKARRAAQPVYEMSREERLNQWVNILTAQGTGADKRRGAYFSRRVIPIDDFELEALYHESDLARTIVERIVLDAVRNEPIYSVVRGGEEEVDVTQNPDAIVAKEIPNRWNVTDVVSEAAIWGRLFGCGGVILGIDDGTPLTEPLQLPIPQGSLKWIEVVDKKNLTPVAYYEDSDRSSIVGDNKVGQVKIYQIQTDATQGIGMTHLLIHESRIIKFGGQTTSNRIKSYNDGCDLSVLQDKYDIIRDVDATWFSMQQLLQDASQAVFKIKDLDNILATNQQQLLDRMRIVDYSKNLGRSIMIDADMEDYYHVGAQNLTGLDALLEQAFSRLAAAARMPKTILMGMSPGGLNATGESDARNWFNQVETYQKKELAHPLSLLMKIVLQSEGQIGPDEEVQVDFPSLWETTEVEKIEILNARADLAIKLINAGLKTAEEVQDWFDK